MKLTLALEENVPLIKENEEEKITTKRQRKIRGKSRGDKLEKTWKKRNASKN